MRKWMRERLQRRKKTAPETPVESKQAPLQPAYFEAEAATPDVEERSSGPEDAQEGGPGPEAQVEQAVAAGSDASDASQPSENADKEDVRRRGRRRRRGGRSRGKQGPERETAVPSEVPAEDGAPVAAATGQTETPPPPTAPRPPKGTVVLAIGLPGSGKSSWFKRHNITPLSSDMLRALLFDDPTEQRFQDLIFSNLRSMLKARLVARRPMNYVDATNLTPHERASWIKLAKDFGYEPQAVFFDVPLDVCLERNRKRERAVSEDVMRRFASKLKAPTFEEGFTKITVVRVRPKE